MTAPTYSCRVGDSLQVVAQLMRDLACACLPVTDEDGEAVGIVTPTDVCHAAAQEELALAAIPVEHAMSGNVVTCQANETATAAVTRMRNHRIHHLPVVDTNNKLIGLLTLGHIARQMLSGADVGVKEDSLLVALVGEPDVAEPETETEPSSVTAA